jgi:hypothetical protein
VVETIIRCAEVLVHDIRHGSRRNSPLPNPPHEGEGTPPVTRGDIS